MTTTQSNLVPRPRAGAPLRRVKDSQQKAAYRSDLLSCGHVVLDYTSAKADRRPCEWCRAAAAGDRTLAQVLSGE